MTLYRYICLMTTFLLVLQWTVDMLYQLHNKPSLKMHIWHLWSTWNLRNFGTLIKVWQNCMSVLSLALGLASGLHSTLFNFWMNLSLWILHELWGEYNFWWWQCPHHVRHIPHWLVIAQPNRKWATLKCLHFSHIFFWTILDSYQIHTDSLKLSWCKLQRFVLINCKQIVVPSNDDILVIELLKKQH